MAEGILRHHFQKRQLHVEVDSAGTANYHVGEEPDHRAIRYMKSRGIDISGLRGRQFSMYDFELFDRIYVMDHSNYKNVTAMAVNEAQKAKVQLILNEVRPGANAEVPDPWFGDMSDFEAVYNMLEQAAEVIAKGISQSED
jgi:protein-tyrosine phosphatase